MKINPIVLGNRRITFKQKLLDDDSVSVKLYCIPEGFSIDSYSEEEKDLVAEFIVLPSANAVFEGQLKSARAQAIEVAETKAKLNKLRAS